MSEKIKVSELNASTEVNNADLIMIVQENNNNELENFKQTRQNFFTGMLSTDDIVSSVSSSSTNSKAVGAKLFYDTIGDLESILEELDIGGGV